MAVNDVIDTFFEGRVEDKCGNIRHQYGAIFSYNTCIAMFDDTRKRLYINGNQYSTTTSRHTNKVRALAKAKSLIIIEESGEALQKREKTAYYDRKARA